MIVPPPGSPLLAAAEAIPDASEGSTSSPWRQAVKNAVRDPLELCRLLGLPSQWEPGAVEAARLFPVFAPRGYIARMQPGDSQDPLLRQVLPLSEEGHPAPGFVHDPVGDQDAILAPGLLRKYRSRALMVTTGACAVHCRYCFRRHYPYSQSPKSLQAWQPALKALAADASIHEVLLSGGDPLMLVDTLLTQLIDSLAQIPHLRRLRIHTRLPVMIPERINEPLLAALRGTRLAPVMVIHANHPAELVGSAAEALERLVDAGVPVLNQAVLLRGINDSVAVLEELCERLVDLRVIPYYLHQLDRVQGAAHFEVPVAEGLELMRQLRARLPGYAVPRYVQELPGEPGKTVLA